jgi:two-component system cell cycle sensor histidine kinase/response regulator CckA
MAIEVPARSRDFAIAAFERSPIGMLVVDVNGNIVAANGEFERMLGYGAGELLGQPLEILVPMKHASAHPELRRSFALNPTHRRMGAGRHLFARHKDGHEVPVEIGLSPVEVEGESFVLATVADITERRRFESRLRQTQKLESIGNLASGIAHEFNNVLHGILGYAELVRDSLRDRPEICSDVDVIIDATARGHDLVNRILLFARKGEPVLKATSLEPTLNEAVQLLRATLPHRIKLRLSLDPNTPEVVADATELHQIIMNLSNNAAHAMGDKGGLIDIQTAPIYVDEKMAAAYPSLRPGMYACMSVIDTGCGIPSELIERIFEPFFTTKDVGEGTGLGLAMIQQIAKSYGGTIEVLSRVGQGTRFDVYIPVAQAAPIDSSRVEVISDRRRILYVDDEERLAHLGRRLLESAGFDVVVHTSSVRALADFSSQPDRFDLVITDNNMPHMTGLELIESMLKVRPNLPVMMVSGIGETIDSAQLKSRGIQRVLAKPYSFSALRSAVTELLAD